VEALLAQDSTQTFITDLQIGIQMGIGLKFMMIQSLHIVALVATLATPMVAEPGQQGSSVGGLALLQLEARLLSRMKTLQPQGDPRVLELLAALLSYHSVLDGDLDINLTIAIGMQESSLRMISTKKDYGLFQIHHNTAKAYGLNIKRLKTDLYYNFRAHSRILKDKIKECHAAYGKLAWSCYHSKTPKYRLRYIEGVRRWLIID
jgi:hypothetical protein